VIIKKIFLKNLHLRFLIPSAHEKKIQITCLGITLLFLASCKEDAATPKVTCINSKVDCEGRLNETSFVCL
jgi:hypothetical protein